MFCFTHKGIKSYYSNYYQKKSDSTVLQQNVGFSLQNILPRSFSKRLALQLSEMFSQLISSLVILSEYKHHSSEYTTVISRQHLPIPDTVMAFEKLLLCTSVVHLLFHFLNVSSFRLNYLGSVKSNTRNRTIPCNVNKTAYYLPFPKMKSRTVMFTKIQENPKNCTRLYMIKYPFFRCLKAKINKHIRWAQYNGNTPAKIRAANQAFCENPEYKKGNYWFW